jgi:N-formylglutamate amidohydrolase
LAQRTYMNEAPPFDYLPEVAAKVQPILERMVQAMIEWRA